MNLESLTDDELVALVFTQKQSTDIEIELSKRLDRQNNKNNELVSTLEDIKILATPEDELIFDENKLIN